MILPCIILLPLTGTVMRLMNESVFPGEFVSWSCEVPSTIPMQFTWYLDDIPVLNVTGSHMNTIANSSYTLNDINYDDNSSAVRCSAAGNMLMVNSDVVYLTGKSLWLILKP